MSEQARKVKEHIPEWAEGLYYNKGLIYYDDEAIYVESRGKDSGIARFTFAMIEGLRIVEEREEAEQEDSPQ